MNKKKNTFVYNPRYGEGAMIKENLRSNILRRQSYFTQPYNETAAVSDDLPNYQPVQLTKSQLKGLGDDGSYTDSGESVMGNALRTAGHFLFGDYENFGERADASSLADAWRLFQEKRL